MTLIDSVKEHMRISPTNKKLDNEISSCIDASIADMACEGIDVSNQYDALNVAAVKLYCDCHVGYRSDAGRYEESYEKLKAKLSLSKRKVR